jgi:hypothetical protein
MLPTDVAVHQGLWYGLTKKARTFPKPWIKGTDYDLSFESLRSSILDSANFLHHKNCRMRFFIEVDASDAGWGACAYQMVHPWMGHPDEEGRGRQGGTGPRKVIQWTSKAWTAFELKLPVFVGVAGKVISFREIQESHRDQHCSWNHLVH